MMQVARPRPKQTLVAPEEKRRAMFWGGTMVGEEAVAATSPTILPAVEGEAETASSDANENP